MGTEETTGTMPFQLQFDKPVASQIKIAEWNPEKDLLAMVTEDSKILLHRFNWQRLWTIPSGRRITSLCWCPDGKAIAVGHEDGTISLHDVENGKLLRSIKSHNAPVVCLSWEEDVQQFEEGGNIFKYEDRTPRFFPSAPRVPRMPGLASGDAGLIDDNDDSFRELSGSSHQRFNILCSGDNEGCLCFSIFGIFPIGKININKFSIHTPSLYQQDTYRLLNASVYKVALSKDLCQLIIMCFGELIEEKVELTNEKMPTHGLVGCHTLLLDISVFWKRKNELHQVAQQASNIEDLFEVIRESISSMSKQWSEAMRMFNDKFDPLSTLIIDHGLDSSPQEEFLSLLGGARTSPALHQFLVNSLGESGLKRVAKTVQSAGKELPIIVRDHLQPAAEILVFRIGELRGLSKWRARFQGIGLDEKLIDNVTEKAGMLLIQVERFLKVLSTMVYQFQNFFTWLTKCVKLLMSEPCDQLPPFNSELIVVFLKFLFGQDPVKQLLENSELECSIEIDLDTIQRLKELAQFGGFSDTEFLRRTLAKEFELLEYSFKEAFQLPFTTISKNLRCEDLLPLFPLSFPRIANSLIFPTSISYYKDVAPASQCRLLDYILFRIPDESFSDVASSIGIVRGFMHDFSKVKKGNASLEAVLLCLPDGCHCVDLSLYKESQIVLLLNETSATSESPGSAQMIILEANDLPFVSISGSDFNQWKLHELKDSIVELQIETEKARSIPHSVVGPLAVSTSRGVACVFAARKRALVYILEEDEDEVSEVD